MTRMYGQLTGDERVMIAMALSAKRAYYLDNWLEAMTPTALGDAKYWAERIVRVNDAAAAFDRLMWGEREN